MNASKIAAFCERVSNAKPVASQITVPMDEAQAVADAAAIAPSLKKALEGVDALVQAYLNRYSEKPLPGGLVGSEVRPEFTIDPDECSEPTSEDYKAAAEPRKLEWIDTGSMWAATSDRGYNCSVVRESKDRYRAQYGALMSSGRSTPDLAMAWCEAMNKEDAYAGPLVEPEIAVPPSERKGLEWKRTSEDLWVANGKRKCSISARGIKKVYFSPWYGAIHGPRCPTFTEAKAWCQEQEDKLFAEQKEGKSDGLSDKM